MTTPLAAREGAPAERVPRVRSLRGLLLKMALLGMLDALVLYALLALAAHEQWWLAGVTAVSAVAVNGVYLSRRALPAKYLVPGTAFLVAFQLFVILYSGYIAFTNYGDGHVGTKDDAVAVLISKSLERLPESPAYDMVVVERDGDLAFLVTDPDGRVSLGAEELPLEPVTGAQIDDDGVAVGLEGYRTLSFPEMIADQRRIGTMSVPVSDNLEDGALRTQDGSLAYLYAATLDYDPTADTFTDLETGTVYADRGTGAFVADDGLEITPGWKITVGFDNFTRAFTEDSIRGPLLGVIGWTFVFAGVSVASTFFVGVLLALLLDDPSIRMRRTLRVLVILPYAFPPFLSALVWSGLLNPEFGFINQTLLGGAEVPWLTDPLLAKVSILAVNLWLGYPYMFLVATGALQSIPRDYVEAAEMDGAGPATTFLRIRLPLLMVTMAPLVISSFAFNFNNFNLIYMLTEGGPQDISTEMNVGATDILITLVYKVAFGEGSGRDYGLASAFSIIIFILISAIAAYSFRRTRALEDVHR
ncbi:sugar ABC transporter permease [Flavimobilis marinus]|uniref:Maltose/maltodextrin transport system permease protein n=1 Tax=Flavimobilis marinus TaxID=285351 RepID=A0A1I2H4N8_9MICO|nr:ABC transporter permease subunit [Flavimobilis marinus]GHG54305.1 sugar ABC transporter permease [Flavimobilis marinus]SFF24340.1 carbohydrate ABC transporter membrane protein 1, CUT1 family [Flavimobilis marinus]